MSSNQGFSSGGKNNPGEPDFSLSDLLPDLMPGATPEAVNRPPTYAESLPSASPDLRDTMPGLFEPSTPFKAPKKPVKKSGSLDSLITGWRVAIIAVLILFGIPLAIFGGFVLIANLGSSLPTPQQLAQQASTPLPTVFSITPPPTPKAAQATATAIAVSHLSPAAATALAQATPAPQPSQAAGNGNATSCNAAPAFVGIAAYPCATTVSSSQNWNAFFAPAITPLGQFGVRLVGNQLRYDIVSDDPAKVISHYSSELRGKGYNVMFGPTTGSVSIGSFQAIQFSKSGQTVQILAISLSQSISDGSAKAGQTVIRYNAT